MTPATLAAIARRYPDKVAPSGAHLIDRETGAMYEPRDARAALGWIAAGEAASAGESPRLTRLASHWHKRA